MRRTRGPPTTPSVSVRLTISVVARRATVRRVFGQTRHVGGRATRDRYGGAGPAWPPGVPTAESGSALSLYLPGLAARTEQSTDQSPRLAKRTPGPPTAPPVLARLASSAVARRATGAAACRFCMPPRTPDARTRARRYACPAARTAARVLHGRGVRRLPNRVPCPAGPAAPHRTARRLANRRLVRRAPDPPITPADLVRPLAISAVARRTTGAAARVGSCVAARVRRLPNPGPPWPLCLPGPPRRPHWPSASGYRRCCMRFLRTVSLDGLTWSVSFAVAVIVARICPPNGLTAFRGGVHTR